MKDPKTLIIFEKDNERLSVSLEYEDDISIPYPILLYVPDTRKPEHEHIHLTNEQAETLGRWLIKNTHIV